MPVVSQTHSPNLCALSVTVSTPLAVLPAYSLPCIVCSVLAGLEPGRTSLQILHENDPCCFRAEGRHDELLAYGASVTAELNARPASGVFSTAVSDWAVHAVCPRDKALIAATLSRVRSAATPTQMTNLSGLPCDMLRGNGVDCPAPLPPAGKVACGDLDEKSACLASKWHCLWQGDGRCVRPRPAPPPPPPPPMPAPKGGWCVNPVRSLYVLEA